MAFSNSILDAIGNTPLLSVDDGIIAKCEYLNPSGSIKARMAKYMIERAEAEGLLKPGDTIVEATSGNTGNAMSMIAAVKGYKMLVLLPRGYSSERMQISKGFGAEIRFVGHFQVDEALEEAKLIGEQDGFYNPAQFDNEWNVEENRTWLAQEIVSQLPDDVTIDAVVQGVGTGGTLVGVSQGLRQLHNPELKAFAMEPTESRIIECCLVADHKIEGIADGFVPTIYERHRHSVDGIVHVTGKAAFDCAHEMAKEQGLFVGPSSGANLWAARTVRDQHPEIKTVLTFMCDKAEKYLTLMHKIEADSQAVGGEMSQKVCA
ncbi:MAG: cysteine synthase family protein [Pseudomonadota bacterium]